MSSALIAALAVLGLGGAAQALSTADIFFDGQVLGDDGEDGWGMTQATAEAASTSLGVPIRNESLANVFEFNQEGDPQRFSFTRVRQSFDTNTPAHATWHWNVTNELGDLNGNLWLVFAKPIANGPGDDGIDNDYLPETVGLTLHDGFANELDWVIFRIPSTVDPTSDPVYYPAVFLGPSMAEDATSGTIAVNYILNDPVIETNASGMELGIPKWELLAVFVVPEPSTAALLGLGLVACAGWRRRRV